MHSRMIENCGQEWSSECSLVRWQDFKKQALLKLVRKLKVLKLPESSIESSRTVTQGLGQIGTWRVVIEMISF